MTDDELLVHADTLMLRGDPLGELIVVARAQRRAPTPERARREAALIAIQEARLAERLPAATRFVWRDGLLDTAALVHPGRGPLVGLDALAGDPAACRLRALHIAAWQHTSAGSLVHVFAELVRLAPRLPHLVEIEVSDRQDTDRLVAGDRAELGELAPLLAAFPRLEVLALAGRTPVLGAIALPAGRRLALADLRTTDVRRIVAAELPCLAELSLAFYDGRVDHVAATFGPLLHRVFPALAALHLAPPAAALDYIVGELATCPLLRGVRRLALRGVLSPRAIDALATAPDVLALDEIVLAGGRLWASQQKRLRERFGRALDVR